MPLAHRTLRRTTRSNQALHAVGWCCQTPAATAALPVGALHGVKHKRVLHTGEDRAASRQLGGCAQGWACLWILPSHLAAALGSVCSLHATSPKPGLPPQRLPSARRPAPRPRGAWRTSCWGTRHLACRGQGCMDTTRSGGRGCLVVWVAWEAHARAEYRPANTNNTALFTQTLAGHVSCTPHVPATQPAPPMLEQVDLHARHFRQLVVQRRKLAQHLLGDRRRWLACRGGQGR